MDNCNGIIVPQTNDGRLIFVISYGGKTMAGTTDVKTEVQYGPKTEKEDEEFIIENIKDTFGEDDLAS